MEMSIQPFGAGLTKVRLSGSLDISGAARIEGELRNTIARQTDIVVDMREVTFISSQGIRVLVATAKGAFARGQKMVLIGPNPSVHKVLTIMSIDKIIPIYDSIEAMTADHGS